MQYCRKDKLKFSKFRRELHAAYLDRLRAFIETEVLKTNLSKDIPIIRQSNSQVPTVSVPPKSSAGPNKRSSSGSTSATTTARSTTTTTT
uniref:Uncharacterized protein n=1 Tax=Ditylenchus dipsaci TaxID=166011 RepID=A0A915E6V5_9BILA